MVAFVSDWLLEVPLVAICCWSVAIDCCVFVTAALSALTRFSAASTAWFCVWRYCSCFWLSVSYGAGQDVVQPFAVWYSLIFCSCSASLVIAACAVATDALAPSVAPTIPLSVPVSALSLAWSVARTCN